MVQRSEPAGIEPTEDSPLLAKPRNANGHGEAYVSIAEISPEGSVNGNGVNGSLTKIRSEDEESRGSGEVEESAGTANVARIISVLLIATQTLYGKLSDIYGRKTMVITAYLIFVVGCAIVAMGQTMWQVILGRVISGAGSSGMAGLVSILITDLLPIRDVAQWRAYVNLVATFGRSIGGPLGGWLVDVIGWRWSFYGQVPPIILAIVLVIIYLPSPPADSEVSDAPNGSAASQKSKLQRIDFQGSILFALAVLALLLPIELGGVKFPWSHPFIISLFAVSAVLVFVFIAVEKRQAEPILPLEIFHRRDAVFSFAILGCQTAAQLGLMFSVPLYFQITQRASNTVSGAHLVPAVVGNALGGVISGVLIKRSGRYKALIITAVSLSSFSYLLLMLRWHGNTNFWESLYIFPSGFGTGIAQSAVFISLQAVISDPSHLAPAISFMYLSSTLSLTVGLPLSNSVMQTVLRRTLRARLLDLGMEVGEISKIIENTVSDVDFVDSVTAKVRDAIVGSYVDGLWWSHGVSFAFSATAFAMALIIRQKPLDGAR
ncbi:hypothetical protein NEMBOFW57_010394 [Staphylotrichum longicolle]|uniref:Major facilitator superfamily (MFS) profile domain-containing protein n=1 Tax=Staphylotrichum longicolle TaxID=669026 RepID=A0AAD4EN11_9PEZI|nr:hypothetical protein NEMBOFW57_010394 [Staphylotrichum longicolle]